MRRKIKKSGIAVIGNVAEGIDLFDGQTIKTRILLSELKATFPNTQIIVVDTYGYRRHPLKVMVSLLKAMWGCRDIFVLLSKNGRRFLFPLINGLNLLFHRCLYHDVIGGSLPQEAQKNKRLVKDLKSFEVNWVELPDMKDELEKLGINNAEVLPNFKRLDILKPTELRRYDKSPYVFTMFSRVCKSKGMTLAAESVSAINEEAGSIKAVLHIYGQVENSYKEEFEALLKEHGDCVTYCGTVPYHESVKRLKDSYMLLFPSTYPGEGMPGTVIDAFSSGLPVIASTWRYNCELVKNHITGFCYDYNAPEELKKMILYAMENPDLVEGMRENCLNEALKYTPAFGMKIIIRRMKDAHKKYE